MTLSAVAILLLPASAGATTRAEYDSQVNQICAATNSQSDQLLRAFLDKQRKVGKRKSSSSKGPDAFLDKEVRRLTRAQVALFSAELAQLQPVTAAPGDEATVSSWLSIRQQEVTLGQTIRSMARANERGAQARSETAKGRAKQRRLDRRLNRLLKQAEGLEAQDSALSNQLGATSCFPSAANGEAIGNLALEG